jgi:lysophospholipase L1-like esterase
MKKQYRFASLMLLSIFVACAIQKPANKPTLFLIGDSTVKNGKDKGDGGLWGWGHYLGEFFKSEQIEVRNHALGGTSTRTYRIIGLWDSVLVKMKPGDYVIMQFGHNDSSPLDDAARARGTIKGNGDESKEIYNPIRKMKETVYSYGWYLRQFIKETKAKGGIPIVCSLIPRNSWKDGKVNRSEYMDWAKAAAEQEGAYFIDLNKLIADEYDAVGEAKVNELYFGSSDHTHTIQGGAIFNARMVIKGIQQNKGLTLDKYLK